MRAGKSLVRKLRKTPIIYGILLSKRHIDSVYVTRNVRRGLIEYEHVRRGLIGYEQYFEAEAINIEWYVEMSNKYYDWA